MQRIYWHFSWWLKFANGPPSKPVGLFTDARCYTVFTLYSQFYNRLYGHSRLNNRLGELCKWAQPSGAWAARSKAAVWTVDDVARLIDIKKNSYLFIFTIVWSCGMTKMRSITTLSKTLLYLFIIWIFKTFRPAGCRPTIGCTASCKVQTFLHTVV